MKRIIALVLTLAMVFALCACGSNSNDSPAADSTKTDAAPAADAAAAAPDKTYELKFAYTLATDHEVSEAFEAFAAGVKEATNGGVVITTYPAGAMGTQPENLESVMTGSLDMCYADTSMLPTYVPAYNMINLRRALLQQRHHRQARRSAVRRHEHDRSWLVLSGLPLHRHQHSLLQRS